MYNTLNYDSKKVKFVSQYLSLSLLGNVALILGQSISEYSQFQFVTQTCKFEKHLSDTLSYLLKCKQWGPLRLVKSNEGIPFYQAINIINEIHYAT